jgi:hypothetical protein
LSWLAWWTLVFFATLAAFAVISALIAIRGIGEIRELFSGLEARERRDEQEE